MVPAIVAPVAGSVYRNPVNRSIPISMLNHPGPKTRGLATTVTGMYVSSPA
ncbi:MAG: hypothetical protein HYW06_05705 [Gemmatimonadetes bacterium]|nr:hypothetical protein [Gemmatimonadota bacterium]